MVNADKPQNIRHWARLQVTDPKHTKPFKKAGGFSGTDISPAYRIQRLTEEFGPCGQGWGYTIQDRWREQFPARDGEPPKDFVFVQLSLWWSEDGERYETGPQIGGTEAGRTPDEAYKMAVTDALGKCALLLGVAADVYLGFFDGSKYQRQHNREEGDRPQRPPQRPAGNSAPPNGNGNGSGYQPTKAEIDAANDYGSKMRRCWLRETLKQVSDDISRQTDWVRKQMRELYPTAQHRVGLLAPDVADQTFSADRWQAILAEVEKAKDLTDFEEAYDELLSRQPESVSEGQRQEILHALERWYARHQAKAGAR